LHVFFVPACQDRSTSISSFRTLFPHILVALATLLTDLPVVSVADTLLPSHAVYEETPLNFPSLLSTTKENSAVSFHKETDAGDITYVEKADNDYFPLTIGNQWVYKRTGSTQYSPHYYFGSAVSVGGAGGPTTFYNSMATHGRLVSRELYTVGKETGKQYTIRIRVDSKRDIPRDGRYTSTGVIRPLRVYWMKENGLVREFMPSDFFKKLQMPGITRSSTEKNADFSRILALFPPYRWAKSYYWGVAAMPHNEAVEVPGGVFENVIKNISAFNSTNIESVALDGAPIVCRTNGAFNNPCFRTESYYAANIGLIKEVQYDDQDNILYSLELVGYQFPIGQVNATETRSPNPGYTTSTDADTAQLLSESPSNVVRTYFVSIKKGDIEKAAKLHTTIYIKTNGGIANVMDELEDFHQKVKDTPILSEVYISNETIKGDAAEVTVLMRWKNEDWAQVPVRLIKEHGAWKISK
jgi:hypothetical protein